MNYNCCENKCNQRNNQYWTDLAQNESETPILCNTFKISTWIKYIPYVSPDNEVITLLNLLLNLCFETTSVKNRNTPILINIILGFEYPRTPILNPNNDWINKAYYRQWINTLLIFAEISCKKVMPYYKIKHITCNTYLFMYATYPGTSV